MEKPEASITEAKPASRWKKFLKGVSSWLSKCWKWVFPEMPERPVRFLLGNLTVPRFTDSRVLVTGALLMFVVNPLTALFFTDGKTVAANNGMPASIVDELAPSKTVRVKSAMLAGRAHNFLGMPNIPWALWMSYQENKTVIANSKNDVFGLGLCAVYIGDFGQRPLKQVLSQTTGLHEADIKNIPISMADFKAAILTHEFAHCAEANDRFEKWYSFGASITKESDAEARGVLAAARARGNPEIVRFMFNWRALQFESAHDTALYVDAVDKGQTPASFDDIKAANKAAAEFVKSGVLVVNPELPAHLSPLTKRRVEIYRDGLRYFTSKPKAPVS